MPVGTQLTAVAVWGERIGVTIKVRGELDVATAGVLAAALDDELDAGHRSVRLDLSGLAFMDCTGVRVLMQAHDRFLAAQGTVVLVATPPRILRLLDVAGVADVLFLERG